MRSFHVALEASDHEAFLTRHALLAKYETMTRSDRLPSSYDLRASSDLYLMFG